ncbi:hypothetical protein [Laspinema olomoucense]|uniref:Uncharacterized protein n=1 Tax=Laspinema olomoucense D3b TaxID=2953688 RepID=A0ABT2N4E9_9CYAN|nr:hypothetical protein [Laspinema sp. D3b]MCT7977574.1 hypothetical protein [Laspinema sp. D3b]
MTKSCLDCQHCHQWHQNQTLWEPGDEGWECNHSKVVSSNDYDPLENLEDPEELASQCEFYEPIDYQALHEFEEYHDNRTTEAIKDYLEALKIHEATLD